MTVFATKYYFSTPTKRGVRSEDEETLEDEEIEEENEEEADGDEPEKDLDEETESAY